MYIAESILRLVISYTNHASHIFKQSPIYTPITKRVFEWKVELLYGYQLRVNHQMMTLLVNEDKTLEKAKWISGEDTGRPNRIDTAFSSFQFILSPDAMALGFGVSMVIGVFFGFYPAAQASRMDPIVALRST